MTFPHSHKTVLVLDKNPYFLESCKETLEFDVFSRRQATGIIPQAPISKTIWTCNVEAFAEYIRIVSDIYPTDKLIRVITCDSSARVLNTWATQEQGLQPILLHLAQDGPPTPGSQDEYEHNIVHGLSQAVEILCEPSPKQHALRTSLTEVANMGGNAGRIICLTNLKNDQHAKSLEECVNDAVMQHNKLAAATDNLMPITHCELILVHVIPVGGASLVAHHPSHDLSSLLSAELHITQSGHFVAQKVVELAITHYDLTSTTVTGIPMKEEQNASSSANYDVELLHHKSAHVDIMQTGLPEGLVMPSREIPGTNTITLKWCTPKSNTVELHPCSGAFRITPVDVNSRPSSCLTNFLLNGRAVMLEQPRKSGAKTLSHMLASHGGEIYIHVLWTTRSILEDPPSISEGCGGRVTDYRINDFGELMKDCRLAPVATVMSDQHPLTRAKAHLERVSRYWPMVIGDTIIFNMPSQLDPLPTLITKEIIDEDDVLECKKVIYHLVAMESKNEALPVQASGVRKGPKRDEHYRQMWAELEKFVRAHADTSPAHEKVLECLVECKKPSEPSHKKGRGSKDVEVKEEKPASPEPAVAWKELDRYNRLTEREKSELNKEDLPPLKKSRPMIDQTMTKASGGLSLLSLWTNRLKTLHNSRHEEFAGRAESEGNIADLYPDLGEETGEMQIDVAKKS